VRPSIAAAALALIPGYVIARGVAMLAHLAATADTEWHALDIFQWRLASYPSSAVLNKAAQAPSVRYTCDTPTETGTF